MRDDLVLLVPEAHWAGSSVDLAALAGERWISGPPDAQNQVALEWAAPAAGFVPDVAFEPTNYAVTMTLVANGLGPAFVPRLIIGSAPAGVRRVDVSGGHDLRRMISIIDRDPVHSEVVTAVIEELRARVGAAGKMPG